LLGLQLKTASASHRRLDRYRVSLPSLGPIVESMLA
jgi:hypothetical protein